MHLLRGEVFRRQIRRAVDQVAPVSRLVSPTLCGGGREALNFICDLCKIQLKGSEVSVIVNKTILSVF
jgi:hypothetical protein